MQKTGQVVTAKSEQCASPIHSRTGRAVVAKSEYQLGSCVSYSAKDWQSCCGQVRVLVRKLCLLFSQGLAELLWPSQNIGQDVVSHIHSRTGRAVVAKSEDWLGSCVSYLLNDLGKSCVSLEFAGFCGLLPHIDWSITRKAYGNIYNSSHFEQLSQNH